MAKFIGTRPAAELDHAKVIQMMVGRDVEEVTTSGREPGKVVLEVKNLTRVGVLQNISFNMRAGRNRDAGRPRRCRPQRSRQLHLRN